MERQIPKTTGGRSRVHNEKILNERGMAMIVAISMLFILSVLGIFSLNNSSTDLQIAGNLRNQMLSFYNAYEVEGWGVNNQSVVSAINPGNVNSYPTGTGMANPTADTQLRVDYLCSTLPPHDLAETSAVAHHYRVTTIGSGLDRGPYGTSQTLVESEQIRIDRVDKNTLDAFPWPRCANNF
jgi:hypothetical protein